MAVSKRLRYEVLRRDNHACRYCGVRAPDVKLTVDHVLPTALGGSDHPSNLAAACGGCNSGKSATPPDAALVADVDRDAARWARAMRGAADLWAAQAAEERETVYAVESAWSRWWLEDRRYADHMMVPVERRQYLPRPERWEHSVRNLHRAGLDPDFMRWAVNEAMHAQHVAREDVFRYFAGICWRELERRRETAAAVLAAEDAEGMH